jgi:hypothetical protein
MEIEYTPAWYSQQLPDNTRLKVGTSADSVLYHSTAAISADAAVTNVIEGSPDHAGTAANSLIVSNTTNDGDILFAVSDGGNSIGILKLDGDIGRPVLHVALHGADGSVSEPGYAFSADTDSGMYRVGANNIALGVNGAVAINQTTVHTEVLSGTAASPGLSFIADPDSGMYRVGANNIALGVNGAVALNQTTGHTEILDGTAGGPGIAFINDTNMGIYRIASARMGFTTAGAIGFELSGSQTLVYHGVPTASASSDLNIDGSKVIHQVSSSRRYKTDERPWTGISKILRKLKPKIFRWENTDLKGWQGDDYGMIAEDGAEAFEPFVNKGENGQINSYRSPVLVSALVGGWQELDKRLQALERKES